ncbi:Protein TIC 20-I, chloroplastic [Dichanthelium oligosanthes]|uniref:Protein TIC 20-I, chloroplastic n=1 Tax=Dichanthelium oligosanthes TaxID=888268 RepID=A0A1E5VK93_9POAL|nr:Protein TIC 20-I, chloroplastic [Dichanthelium oligosanthes]
MVVENSCLCAILAATPQHVVLCRRNLPAAHLLAGFFAAVHLHRYHDPVSWVALSGDIYDSVLLRCEAEVVTALSEVPCDPGYPPGHWLPSSGHYVYLDAKHRVSGETDAVLLDVYRVHTDLHSARVYAVLTIQDPGYEKIGFLK